MAVTHPTAIRNGIANHVVDQLDQGSANPTPRLILQTSGAAAVATLNMDGTAAFGDAAAGVATANAIADDTNTNAGTATQCILTDKDNTTIIQGSVGTSGEDINLSSNVFASGDTARITSLTYTAPA